MKTKHTEASRKLPSGFTLIEILVSLGIIAVLATLILPVLKSTQDSAKTAACASNLGQIGKAFFAYAADNDGTLPPANDSTQTWPMSTYMYQLNPYLGNLPTIYFSEQLKICFDGVFRCPGKKNWSLAGPTDMQRNSFGMNTFDPNNVPSTGKKLVAIEKPSKTLLVADLETGYWALRNNAYMYRDFIALRHHKKDNVLFCDGHVEALPKDSFEWGIMVLP